MCAVRPALVVELPPALDQHLGLGPAAEPFAVEQLLAQFAVEALHEAVLPRTARGDEGRADRGVAQPAHDLRRSELGAVVRAHERRLAVQPHQPRQGQDHILRPQAGSDLDDQTFPCVLVDHAQQLQAATVHHLVVHEVVAPHGVGPNGTGQADVAAAAPTPWTPARDVQAQRTPQTPDPGLPHAEPGRHPPVAEPRHLR